MPRKLSAKSFLRNSKHLILLLISTVAFFILLFLANNLFLISEVKIVTTEKIPDLKGLEELKGKNLLIISKDEVKKILSKRNPQIKIIKIEKKYPHSIILTTRFDKPAAALIVDQGYFILGEDSKILDKKKEAKVVQVPMIFYYQKLNYSSYEVGDRIEFEDILIALHFVKKLSQMGLKTDKVDINGLNMIRLNLNEDTIIFTTEKGINLQEYQLEKLIHQFKVEGKTFEVIDLRFNKPIIKLR